MEDYPRDLEKELIKYSVPNPFNQARNWQLLFVSDDGKTIAIKKYKRLVFGTLAFLIFCFVVACAFSFLYFKAVTKNEELATSLEDKSNKLRQVTEENDLLETKLWFINEGNKKEKAAATQVKEAKLPKKDKTKPAPEKTEKMKAAAEELSFTKVEGSPTTKIRFLIRNQSTLKRISGYVHVIMKPDLESQQGWLTLPPVVLKDGGPSVPSKGRYFSINNFKSMHFKYNDKNLVQVYNNVTVFIYSKSGEKVYEKTYPVEIKMLKKKEEKKKKSVQAKPKVSKKKQVPAETKKNKSAVTLKKETVTADASRTKTIETKVAVPENKNVTEQEPRKSENEKKKEPEQKEPPAIQTEP